MTALLVLIALILCAPSLNLAKQIGASDAQNLRTLAVECSEKCITSCVCTLANQCQCGSQWCSGSRPECVQFTSSGSCGDQTANCALEGPPTAPQATTPSRPPSRTMMRLLTVAPLRPPSTSPIIAMMMQAAANLAESPTTGPPTGTSTVGAVSSSSPTPAASASMTHLLTVAPLRPPSMSPIIEPIGKPTMMMLAANLSGSPTKGPAVGTSPTTTVEAVSSSSSPTPAVSASMTHLSVNPSAPPS
jgi:hypothetical protein